jgi:DNA-binding response OmpR family regulator
MLDSSSPVRILIVDDDQDTCTLIKTALSNMQAEFVCMGDAESAMVRVRTDKKKFDLILSDFMLPGLSGLEMVALLKQTIVNLPPIMMITAHSPNYDMEQRAREAGASHIIHKPFTLSQLRVPVMQLLRDRLQPAAVHQG